MYYTYAIIHTHTGREIKGKAKESELDDEYRGPWLSLANKEIRVENQWKSGLRMALKVVNIK